MHIQLSKLECFFGFHNETLEAVKWWLAERFLHIIFLIHNEQFALASKSMW